MKIYTRTGDEGETGLFGGPRISKDAVRLEAYGTVDELNSFLGLARAEGLPEEVDRVLARLQAELFEVGAELATLDPPAHGTRTIGPKQVEAMELEIDAFQATLPPLAHFILPAGTPSAAALHVARAVCRRAERHVVTMRQLEPETSSISVIFLNRLGDLLFVVARRANQLAGLPDAPWHARKPKIP
jgi:cob(I)alamin adenosyltransferase